MVSNGMEGGGICILPGGYTPFASHPQSSPSLHTGVSGARWVFRIQTTRSVAAAPPDTAWNREPGGVDLERDGGEAVRARGPGHSRRWLPLPVAPGLYVRELRPKRLGCSSVAVAGVGELGPAGSPQSRAWRTEGIPTSRPTHH